MRGRECFLCKTTRSLEEHHVFFGPGFRQLSQRYGMKADLCALHHRGPKGVHCNRALDLYLKRIFQARFEETHSRREFMDLFERNYL